MLYFLLNGDVTFATNTDGGTFAAHVRYFENCSGWVSDGPSDPTDSGNCGGSTTVPEPGIIGLLAIGLLGVAGVRRFKA